MTTFLALTILVRSRLGVVMGAKEQFPSLPLIVISGYPDINLAVDLMKKGVKDYLVKPVEKEKLLEAVKKAISERYSG